MERMIIMNILDRIMGVKEAGELWGLSPDRVKGLCQSGEVKAKKIGNSWALDRNQANPRKHRASEPLIWELSLKCQKMITDENNDLRKDYEQRMSHIYEKTKAELGAEIADKLNKKLRHAVKVYREEGAWDFVGGSE
jgi:hypothetical protein